MRSTVSKIFNRLYFEFLKSGIRRSDQIYVSLQKASAAPSLNLHLKEKYDEYTRMISTPEMAASFECLSLLDGMCRKESYRKILDLGSGFSSFVFRMYAREQPGVEVWSVDDDEHWIEKTRAFLEGNGLGNGHLLMIEEFLQWNERDFDLVFVDLNFVDVRRKYIQLAVECCKSGGAIIFDDVHKQEFMFDVLSRSRQLPVRFFDIKSLTLDRFGRFALLGLKQ